jgi:hypothetical protein
MMEAAGISQTFVTFYLNTWCNNPENAITILAAVRT